MTRPLRSLRSDVIAHRARIVAGRERDPAATAVFVRVISARKGRAAVHGLLSYVARHGEHYADRPDAELRLRDAFGHETPFEDIYRDWPMRADAQNLRPAARELARSGRVRAIRALPERDRFFRRSAYHLVISLQCAPDEEDAAAAILEAATADVVERAFGQEGYHAGWTIHRDIAGRPHAHIVVSAETDSLDEKGRPERLRLDPDDLDALRYLVWDAMKSWGAHADWTRRLDWSRREDRAELRDAVLDGSVPLREPKYGDKRPMVEAGGIAERAPAWVARHGAQAETRWLLADTTRRGGLGASGDLTDGAGEAPIDLRARLGLRRRPTPPVIRQLMEFAGCRDPAEAGLCWAELAREDRGLADWLIQRRPETFGLLRDSQPRPDRVRLRRVLADIGPDMVRDAPQGGLAVQVEASELDRLRALRAAELRAGRARRVLRSLARLERDARDVLGEGRTVQRLAGVVRVLEREAAAAPIAAVGEGSKRPAPSWRRRFVRPRGGDAR